MPRRGEVVSSRPALLRAAPEPGSAVPFTFAVMCDSRADKNVGEASYRGVNMRMLRQHLARAFRSGAAFETSLKKWP